MLQFEFKLHNETNNKAIFEKKSYSGMQKLSSRTRGFANKINVSFDCNLITQKNNHFYKLDRRS